MLRREVSNRNAQPDSPRELVKGSLDALSLSRQGSMNLPTPEESGVPSVHPDVCIMRIRRNHLVEVRLSIVMQTAIGFCRTEHQLV